MSKDPAKAQNVAKRRIYRVYPVAVRMSRSGGFAHEGRAEGRLEVLLQLFGHFKKPLPCGSARPQRFVHGEDEALRNRGQFGGAEKIVSELAAACFQCDRGLAPQSLGSYPQIVHGDPAIENGVERNAVEGPAGGRSQILR